MENQEVNHRQPLSMLGVIKETMNTIVRNRKPMKLIICLLFLTNIQFHVATRYDLPYHQKQFSFQISYRESVNTQKHVTNEVHEQLMTRLHILICSCCLFLYLAIITISSSYECYTRNTSSIINAFFRVSRNWKRPLVTSGCILSLSSGIYIAYGIVYGVISFSPKRSISRVDSSSFFYLSALQWICSAYMASLWMMSLVVTVLENNISGLKAITRAGDLMKGKRIQASLLIMVYYVSCLLVKETFESMSSMVLEELAFEESAFEEWAMWAIRIPFVAGYTSVFEVFVFVFYTVFYHECKMEHKEDGILNAGSVADKTS